MDERLRVRQEQSKPIYEELFIWATEKQKEFIPSRPERKAIQYFLNEHDKMKMYLEHPEADIDNNYVERTIRPLTIGRKNYLFAGSEQGAKRMAIIYSFVLSCRIHNIDPYKYFLKVFELMAKEPEMNLDNLLPDKIKI